MQQTIKQRDIAGWLIIDKPQGITSAAVVRRVKSVYQVKKVGHAGTLDPLATGVLAVAIGEATKTIPFVTESLKVYAFVMRLGEATDTDDAEGKVIATSGRRPSKNELQRVLKDFVGDVRQIPPNYSAIKVKGQRAYALARTGHSPQLSARRVRIEKLVLCEQPDNDHLSLRITCGKGTYVRSVARDIGKRLGCFAHIRSLRRLSSAPFSIVDALPYEQIARSADPFELDDRILPVESALIDLHEVNCSNEQAQRLQNGNPVQIAPPPNEVAHRCWASLNGRVIAVGKYSDGLLRPSRVFRY
ncbi:MAG: tRNA pseudouridine(55) synthase TruB [Aestuariivita sp.]|nr:tRNA pseudouridine(55) synthase TruB [Aestuariivita sp.]MCY4347525.1 tRNA pseudouridine(55) synthase TruB [Aestuariivita sp.]